VDGGSVRSVERSVFRLGNDDDQAAI